MDSKLVQLTNGYVANLGLDYIKVHNLHWNVEGGQFKAAHEFLEGIYNGLAGALDDVAEVLKQQNEMPLASLKDYLAAATLEELPNQPYTVSEALQTLLADLKTLRNQALELRKAASEQDNFVLSNLLEDHIANYDKNIWFVSSMLK